MIDNRLWVRFMTAQPSHLWPLKAQGSIGCTEMTPAKRGAIASFGSIVGEELGEDWLRRPLPHRRRECREEQHCHEAAPGVEPGIRTAGSRYIARSHHGGSSTAEPRSDDGRGKADRSYSLMDQDPSGAVQ